MNILLDTHLALWALTDDPNFSKQARVLISSPANRVFSSVASMWEIAIKRAIHPDRMPISSIEFLHFCEQAGYENIPIRERHVIALESLPAIHGDPFDRILIAQALAESMLFLTHDRILGDYGETVRVV